MDADNTLSTNAKTLGDICAFPWESYPGQTLRHWFAGLAMQGLCANSIPGSHHHAENKAREAVEYADALLKELAK